MNPIEVAMDFACQYFGHTPTQASFELIDGKPADNEVPATPQDATASSSMRDVLLGNAEFFETGIKEALDISQLSKAVSSDSTVTAEATKFAIIDLDNDGTNEVILWLTVNGNDEYGCEILCYQNGAVYGYVMWYRAFNHVKTDGTFSFSGGAADSGFGTIKFAEQTFAVDKLAYSESRYERLFQKKSYQFAAYRFVSC